MTVSSYETPVVFCYDEKFSKHVDVAVASLLAHSEAHLSIHCIVHGVALEDRSRLEKLVRRFGSRVAFHEADHNRFATWKTGRHFSPANYYRLLIPSLISSEKALYLDGDVIVTRDLAPLLSMELSQNWIAGCTDRVGRALSPIKIAASDPYINSGVMLLNLKAMREIDMLARCTDLHNTDSDKVAFADQCLLNKSCETKKVTLDEIWNIQSHNYSNFDLKRQISSFDRKCIFHGSGAQKPWMKWSDQWLVELWSSYARLVETPLVDLLVEPVTVSQNMERAKSLEVEGRWEEAGQIKNTVIQHLSSKLDRMASSPAGKGRT